MWNKLLFFAVLLAVAFLSGCASVKMVDPSMDAEAKQFAAPAADESILYLYRTGSFAGGGLKKDIWVDGKYIGESSSCPSGTFFKISVTPGKHVISTESEFSPNHILINARGGEDYYIQQYARPGIFVGGAEMKLVSKEEGRQQILSSCKLAQRQEGKKADLQNIEQLKTELKEEVPAPYKPSRKSDSEDL